MRVVFQVLFLTSMAKSSRLKKERNDLRGFRKLAAITVVASGYGGKRSKMLQVREEGPLIPPA